MQKLLLQYRPFERVAGETERVYEACLDDLTHTIESTPVKPAVQLAAVRDSMLRARPLPRHPRKAYRSTPLIGGQALPPPL